MGSNIVHRSFLTDEQIKKVEEKYTAKYVCDTSMITKDGSYANTPVAVFYTEEPHPEGSNYFGLFVKFYEDLYICNAIEVVDQVFDGVVDSKGNVYYSAYRHDFFETDEVMIDGGRDYTRHRGELIKMKVNKDKLEIVGGLS